MKKNYFLVGLAIATAGLFAFRSNSSLEIGHFTGKYSSGVMTGATGAPGEGNCTQCHAGAVQDGSSQNNLTIMDGSTPVLTYLPGQTYNVWLVLASDPDKKGFSATALDGTNTKAGSFTGMTVGGTQKITAGGRDYASHTSSSNTSATNSVWIWEWTAPATDVGNVTFYVASNEANNNGNNQGDLIYLSQHVISIDPSAGITEEIEATNFMAGYSPANHSIDVDFSYKSVGEMYLNLVDMNGRSVYTLNMGESQIGENKESIALPSEIENGIYVVNFMIGNKAMSSKVMIQR